MLLVRRLAWPIGGRAQDSRVFRVGSAFVASEPIVTKLEAAFLSVLRDRGYVVGRNLIYEFAMRMANPPVCHLWSMN